VVQQVAEEHQGKVVFSSVPGRGTTFTVTLPLVAGRPGDEAVLQ
jgi:signal transduction histidine kinase